MASHELARNALGLPQILFCIVTGSAPIAAMMFNGPLSIRGIGISAPAAFWLAMLGFAFFSVGYVEMARRVTTAGGIYSYMSYGFGRVVGLGSAVAIAAAYMLFAVGVNGITAYFAQVNIEHMSGGFDMDWRIYAFLFLLLTLAVTYFHIEFVAKLLGFALVGELLVLLIFAFAVVVRGGPDGIMWEALNPAGLFSGGEGVAGADEVFKSVGGAAAGIGFFAAMWSWVGFEMAPNYAEEARNPKKMMAYAIYISAIGLGILYTFVSWMLITSYGGDRSLWAVAAQYGIDPENGPVNAGYPNGDFSSIFYPVVQDFAGVGVTNIFRVLIITSGFAVTLAFWNTANRYLFAMGRESILPRILGRTHATHKSPFMATIVVFLFTIMVTALFATGAAGTGFQQTLGIERSDPLVSLVEIATWMPFQGNMLLFPLMSLVNIAVIIHFLRPENREGFHWFKTFVAPIIGAGAIAFAVYLMYKNRAFLTTGEYKGWTKAVPYYSLGIFLGGCLLAILYRWRSKERYEAVGKFVHEDA
ncbi:MAG: APC family permease [Thermoleophilia bacterium]|nr:APC family permease [Thermoleophilia bacterium]